MMRVKLGLTDEELMNKSWISLCLESADFPYYDPSGKQVLTGKEAGNFLDKFTEKP